MKALNSLIFQWKRKKRQKEYPDFELGPFCCAVFKNMVENAGERGLSFVVQRYKMDLHCLWMSRGISFEDEQRLNKLTLEERNNAFNTSDYRVNIRSASGLPYCPGCGQRTQDMVDTSPIAFAELAEAHKEIYGDPMKPT